MEESRLGGIHTGAAGSPPGSRDTALSFPQNPPESERGAERRGAQGPQAKVAGLLVTTPGLQAAWPPWLTAESGTIGMLGRLPKNSFFSRILAPELRPVWF